MSSLAPNSPAERRNGTSRVSTRFPDMTAYAAGGRSRRLYLKDDPTLLRQQAVGIHLRRRHRARRLSREPRQTWWQQPIGAACTTILMAGLIVAMFACLWVVGSGGGHP